MKKEEPPESLFDHLRISDDESDGILSNPYSRLWHDCINRALKDMWSRNKEASDSARRWIYDDDTSPINSFDNIMLSLGYNPDVFREKMMIPKERMRIKKLFKQQGFRTDLIKD
jgi:hypothetical protein